MQSAVHSDDRMTTDTLESPAAAFAAELDGDLDRDTGDFGFGHTQQDVAFLTDALGLEHGSATLLDAGCGGGRWALELARRGDVVTGIDRDPARIVRARHRALASGLHD